MRHAFYVLLGNFAEDIWLRTWSVQRLSVAFCPCPDKPGAEGFFPNFVGLSGIRTMNLQSAVCDSLRRFLLRFHALPLASSYRELGSSPRTPLLLHQRDVVGCGPDDGHLFCSRFDTPYSLHWLPFEHTSGLWSGQFPAKLIDIDWWIDTV